MAMAAMIASAPSPNPMRSLQLNNNSNNNACKYLSFSLQLPLLCFANHNNSNKAATSAAGGAWRQSMFLNAKPLIKDGALRFNGKNAVLMGVPDNVLLTPCTDSSAFVGATNSPHSSSRLVFKLGTLTQDTRFLCLFRFKIFWMIPRVGNKGSDIPVETQMLLLEAREPRGSVSYVLFLPVLDGQFRSSLQGNSANELEICVESGDPAVVASESLKAVFVNNGNNPFDLMTESMKILEKYSGTFAVRESKQTPGILDCFGWCTWDAFYTDVNPSGIRDGLKSLSDGGTPARFLIIDDGWQDTSNEFQKEGEPKVEGSQFGGRLVSIEENKKFRETANGLKDFVSDIKRTFGLKYVYVWHALMGYWGGLHPEAPSTKKYNPELKYPVQSPGNLANMRDLSMDCMEKYGVGAIDPTKAEEFYDDLHKYLVSQEVDGVKVDVQNLLETIAAGTGGRVFLTTHFQQALEKSIATNFKDNSIICCMGHNTDSVYSSKRSAITRASDDYYPRNPETQTLHIAAVAYNSIFFGEVMVPDWDMFYSRHNAAEFHAVARAVGGCPVYVSDKPGQHDFKILRRLVLPDGSVLRAKSPGRPTRDCLFIDPVMDGKSLLKIWNLNKLSGVIGVFNCQGAGSWPCMDVINGGGSVDELTGKVSPADIEYFEQEVVGGEESWTGHCAVFSFSAGSLTRLPKQQRFGVTLKSLQCDVFTVSPIKIYTPKIQFAPIGLIDMYNSGGAVEAVEFYRDGLNCRISVKGNGAGRFGAYSSQKPSLCYLNSKQQQGFNFSVEQNLFTTTIPDDVNSWDITIAY
ncbi:probable galactinol--sucrose galactosyltransferase 2 isoform X2 [Diospyros lotus]|uniref:probable galactinol--sucrose galactosyltransferase 2 isoform X2 n=1 Tax=Diospyros lotus TaxID=55363 RepID=UPI00225A95CB|nr:probable galactinol--sucrose galactosyltransferase 2 isoform X2 [Diospyros lotus]